MVLYVLHCDIPLETRLRLDSQGPAVLEPANSVVVDDPRVPFHGPGWD